LIDHLVDDGRRRGLARIFLETETHNTSARRLYARHGFVEDDSIWMSLEFTDLS
jgi:ribosomal protein S18 acetylase RimI-like enzyme